jgi:hypothetical protein
LWRAGESSLNYWVGKSYVPRDIEFHTAPQDDRPDVPRTFVIKHRFEAGKVYEMPAMRGNEQMLVGPPATPLLDYERLQSPGSFLVRARLSGDFYSVASENQNGTVEAHLNAIQVPTINATTSVPVNLAGDASMVGRFPVTSGMIR